MWKLASLAQGSKPLAYKHVGQDSSPAQGVHARLGRGRLPHPGDDLIRLLQRRWQLRPGAPLPAGEASCSWVAPVIGPADEPAVLKIGLPHFEAEGEIDGLRFWRGDPTVHLLNADEASGAMLLERCEPGTSLRSLPEAEQDRTIAALLRRLWRRPSAPHPFRHLSTMTARWSEETHVTENLWPDKGLVAEGLRLFAELATPTEGDVLLATDLHAGNVLRAVREEWLVIDPKPFLGDPAYDATQHLFNCPARLKSDPEDVISRFADLLGVDRTRVRLWIFARAAAEPRSRWRKDWIWRLARTLAA